MNMRTITTCRSCWSDQLTKILDLGVQYTSDFRKDKSKPPKYPIVVVLCEECKLLQLQHTTPSEVMYHDNYGFKSGVSNSIKDDLKDVVSTALEYVSPRNWLDIASNDGTLLSYVPDSIFKVGVDPITKYCTEAKEYADVIINDFFNLKSFESYMEKEKFDVITSISCFYDMDYPNTFVSDVTKVLSDNGIWVIQQNYLGTTMNLNAVDNVCHEHLTYFTLLSLEPLLERHGLEVIDLSTSLVNGGSLRTIVAKKGAYPVYGSVQQLRQAEADLKFNEISTYKEFARNIWTNLLALKKLINEINERGETVCILAASTRGATIWQSIDLTKKDVPYAVERNPEKVGRYFSAIGIPIISEEEAHKKKPDYMIVGPWFFAAEIVQREAKYLDSGGKLIVPLPKLTIVG